MAEISVVNQKAEQVSQKDLPEDIFNVEVKPSVLHEVVRMQLASRRSGTSAVKRRSDVRGSRRKLFRQKGTGRARRGDIKSPLLRGGGVVFGPSPRSYAFKVPKKLRRLALKMALSAKFQEESLMVLDNLELGEIKTREFVQVMDALKVSNALFVVDHADDKIKLSSRNVPGVKVLPLQGLNVYDILKYQHLVLVEPTIEGIEGRLKA
jgi:large subunit ribosomal protein L4